MTHQKGQLHVNKDFGRVKKKYLKDKKGLLMQKRRSYHLRDKEAGEETVIQTPEIRGKAVRESPTRVLAFNKGIQLLSTYGSAMTLNSLTMNLQFVTCCEEKASEVD